MFICHAKYIKEFSPTYFIAFDENKTDAITIIIIPLKAAQYVKGSIHNNKKELELRLRLLLQPMLYIRK